MHSKACTRAVKVDFDGILPYGNHPEYVVPINVDVVVVDLCINAGRSHRTGVQIKSNKGECASVVATVRADELALAEAHIGLERQPRHRPRGQICSSSTTAYMC